MASVCANMAHASLSKPSLYHLCNFGQFANWILSEVHLRSRECSNVGEMYRFYSRRSQICMALAESFKSLHASLTHIESECPQSITFKGHCWRMRYILYCLMLACLFYSMVTFSVRSKWLKMGFERAFWKYSNL